MAAMFAPKADRSPSPKSPRYVYDEEFGRIRTKRNARAVYVRLKINQDGELEATLPPRAPLRAVSHLLNDARDEIRGLLQKHAAKVTTHYEDGQSIGQSHRLSIVVDDVSAQPSRSIKHQLLRVTLPRGAEPTSTVSQDYIRASVKKALEKEARAYLPRRLQYLADTYGMTFESIRYGNQKGRWGSCSSRGTISLNVGLMGLSLELIDYVLIHELCHTKHMNHSQAFWGLVESCLPDYRDRRKALKDEHPA